MERIIKDKAFSVRIPLKLWMRLQRLAKKFGISRNEALCRVIEKGTARKDEKMKDFTL